MSAVYRNQGEKIQCNWGDFEYLGCFCADILCEKENKRITTVDPLHLGSACLISMDKIVYSCLGPVK